jgi:CheY-like chemotaxis protein
VPKPVLIVDDSADDAAMLEAMLRAQGVTNPIQTVFSAIEATAYLRGDFGYSDRVRYPLPKIILLDLKMPVMDGFEFLEWLRANEKIGQFKVIVVSGLEDVGSIKHAYTAGARSFLAKPYTTAELENLLRGFPGCWMRNDPPPPQAQASPQ